MREILFRGKRYCNGTWVEGSLLAWPDGSTEICYDNPENDDELLKSIVYPETVGQYTGLTDKNGKKIFEGDILEEKIRTCPGKDGSPKYRTRKYIVRYDAWTFRLEGIGARGKPSRCMHNLYAIGNIHDNPELLEV